MSGSRSSSVCWYLARSGEVRSRHDPARQVLRRPMGLPAKRANVHPGRKAI